METREIGWSVVKENRGNREDLSRGLEREEGRESERKREGGRESETERKRERERERGGGGGGGETERVRDRVRKGGGGGIFLSKLRYYGLYINFNRVERFLTASGLET